MRRKSGVADADTTESPFLPSSLPPPLAPSSLVLDDACDAIPPWMFKERGRKQGRKEGRKEGDPMPTPLHSSLPTARRGKRPGQWVGTAAGAPVLQAVAVGRSVVWMKYIMGILMWSRECLSGGGMKLDSNFEANYSTPRRSLSIYVPRPDSKDITNNRAVNQLKGH